MGGLEPLPVLDQSHSESGETFLALGFSALEEEGWTDT